MLEDRVDPLVFGRGDWRGVRGKGILPAARDGVFVAFKQRFLPQEADREEVDRRLVGRVTKFGLEAKEARILAPAAKRRQRARQASL